MVAKITVPQSVRRALNYNEQKVKEGKAECLHAANFLKDAHEMNFHEKLERFNRNIELNKSKTNTLHISLNFHESDKISSEKMLQVANDYMQKIGFGDQPYLVYRHDDAGHDHCHIVTTNIKDDGKRIDTFNIGKNLSEPARKQLEEEYGLTKAERSKQIKPEKLDFAQKIEYGKAESKRAITNVLDAVVNNYKYGSLAELNAILRLYNVEADPGKEGSRTRDKGGLYFRILDNNGKKIGVPIKASSIYSQPTLNNLEKKFEKNEKLKQGDRRATRAKVNWVLSTLPTSLGEFVDSLKSENIDAVLRQNKDGQLYGLTFVDHDNKCVFNGSDLGKGYSARSIVEGFQESLITLDHIDNNIVEKTNNKSQAKSKDIVVNEKNLDNPEVDKNQQQSYILLQDLLQEEMHTPHINPELRNNKRRSKQANRNIEEEHEI